MDSADAACLLDPFCMLSLVRELAPVAEGGERPTRPSQKPAVTIRICLPLFTLYCILVSLNLSEFLLTY